MPREETVTHEGIVLKVPGNGTADVEIITGGACAGCHSKSVCSLGNTETRTVTVKSDANLHPGDHVTVVMDLSQGFRAITIGYVIPLAVIIVAFTILTLAGAGELISALGSFGVLALYYVAAWLLRKKIDRKFEFRIKN